MGFGKYSASGTLLPPEQQGAAFDFRPQRTVSITRAECIPHAPSFRYGDPELFQYKDTETRGDP